MSEDKSEADDVAANLDRRKHLEKMFGEDGESIEWLEKWRDARDGALKKIGLDISASYDVLGMAALGSGDTDTGFGGDFTVNGTWQIAGRRLDLPLDLHFRLRHRDAFGDTAPSGVASQTGTLWGLVDGFSDSGFEVPDFYLLQKIPKYGIEIRYGQMVIDSQFDRHSLRSSKQAFLNRAFSANPAVAFPRFGAGVTLHRKCSSGLDYTLGACSVQGTQTGTQVDFNFGSDAYFKAAQIGWDFKIRDDPARIQAMVWHSDPVPDANLPDGKGLSLVFERALPEHSAKLFARVAWADGAAADLDHLFAVGAAVDRRENDLLGLALGMGRDSSGTEDWQGVIEGFYRWQVGSMLHITPSLQLVFGESLPGRDIRLVAGLRGSVAF